MSNVETGHDGDDAPLLDLLDDPVDDRSRVAAAEALGVNYRTMMACYDSRRVSRRMRHALEEFRDAASVADDESGDVDDPEDVRSESLGRRVAAPEDENRELRKLVEEQAGQVESLARRLDALEGIQEPDNSERFTAVDDDVNGHDQGDRVAQDWRPPRRRPGLPDAGVITLEEQPEEEHAFGPAAALVAEWRELRAISDQAESRVDRAKASVCRWELEAVMLGEYT